MFRLNAVIAPVAALSLLIGFHQAQLRADDTAAPAAKAKVTVTVVDSTGKAVTGATVGIYPKAAKKHKGAAAVADAGATTQPTDGAKPAKAQAMVTGETGADGTVVLASVPNGDFSIRARLKGTGNGMATVTVADSKDEAVSVTLKAKAAKN